MRWIYSIEKCKTQNLQARHVCPAAGKAGFRACFSRLRHGRGARDAEGSRTAQMASSDNGRSEERRAGHGGGQALRVPVGHRGMARHAQEGLLQHRGSLLPDCGGG